MEDVTPGWRETKRVVGVPVSLNSSSSTRRGNSFFLVTDCSNVYRVYKTLLHRSLVVVREFLGGPLGPKVEVVLNCL
ncbi:unnamed protein product [Sphagnum balticum]